MEWHLPKDPVMLLSYVNTQLRDHYASLAEFCKANGLFEEELKEKLSVIEYVYDETANQFHFYAQGR